MIKKRGTCGRYCGCYSLNFNDFEQRRHSFDLWLMLSVKLQHIAFGWAELHDNISVAGQQVAIQSVSSSPWSFEVQRHSVVK